MSYDQCTGFARPRAATPPPSSRWRARCRTTSSGSPTKCSATSRRARRHPGGPDPAHSEAQHVSRRKPVSHLGLSRGRQRHPRSEEHTSELQSPCNLVCRLLLEKKKKHKKTTTLL